MSNMSDHATDIMNRVERQDENAYWKFRQFQIDIKEKTMAGGIRKLIDFYYHHKNCKK